MLKYIKLVLIFIMIFGLAWELHVYMPILIQWVRELGAYAFIGFFILYCVTILLFVPIEPIVFASGAIFGFCSGFLISLFCGVVSSAMAFIISRHFGCHWLPHKKNKTIMHWIDSLESFGWKSLAVSRLTPFLPCSLVNYGYGLTKIRLLVYNVTNLVFFIPYKLLLTYFGSVIS